MTGDPITLNGYRGSKAASGVCEQIIGQMPPHRIYFELFAGYAAVWRRKLPAEKSFLVDQDASTCAALKSYLASCDDRRGDVLLDDALRILASHPAMLDRETLVYADPPYLRSVRTRLFYDWEFDSVEQHTTLLTALLEAKCMVMISGYLSQLYSTLLQGWRFLSFPAMTRGGVRTEYLWCNFPEPDLLHDSRFAGKNFRERERIARKRARWLTRFSAMPPRERQCIAEALAAADPKTLAAAMRASSTAVVGPDRD